MIAQVVNHYTDAVLGHFSFAETPRLGETITMLNGDEFTIVKVNHKTIDETKETETILSVKKSI